MKHFFCLLLMMSCYAGAMAQNDELHAFRWSQVSALPDAEGFASPFAGVSHDALLVAGGANIPKDKWADVFQKVWYDTVFVLEKREGTWKPAGKLPHPLGYGISVSADERVLCFGGSDATRHFAEGFSLAWVKGQLVTEALPSLPRPCAHACAALVGRTIYVAGGTESPTATTAMHSFWAFDLDAKVKAWRELEAWPGAARLLAVAGTMDGAFYLFSGASLAAGADGKPVREYLRDAYRFTPGVGWKQLADLPRAVVAAPSPAVVQGSQLLIISGDDGAHVNFQPVTKHPGFPRQILGYDTVKETWSVVGEAPFSRATAPTVLWGKDVVIPNGEVRPRLRTPEVWSLKMAE